VDGLSLRDQSPANQSFSAASSVISTPVSALLTGQPALACSAATAALAALVTLVVLGERRATVAVPVDAAAG